MYLQQVKSDSSTKGSFPTDATMFELDAFHASTGIFREAHRTNSEGFTFWEAAKSSTFLNGQRFNKHELELPTVKVLRIYLFIS